jgi:glycine cleavage system aminomethyltransferase T
MQGKRLLKHTPYVPYNPDVFTYVQSEGGMVTPAGSGGFHPFEYEGWAKECLSWHETCYIHAGLNPINTYKIKGPDAIKLLSDHSINSFKNFPVGRSKHLIMCNEEGKIIIHGLAQRIAEDEIMTYWLWPYLEFAMKSGNYNVTGENLTGKVFGYQMAGPRNLEIIEAASGENLHDIGFLRYKYTKIAGRDVMIYRIGMAGKLAYEVHGKIEDAIPVYNALIEAGEPYGLRKLGRHAYRVVHTEGGFPQVTVHFPFAGREGMVEYYMGLNLTNLTQPNFVGSMPPDHELQLRTPLDVGWGKWINFDHDFVGKEALEKIVKENKYTVAMLEWDPESVLDVYRSKFDQTKNVSNMEWGEDFSNNRGSNEYHSDAILDENGNIIGISSGRMFSPYFRKMISMATIETKYSSLGTEVDVLWGDPGTDQMKIKAVVARYPYIDKDRNEHVDTSTIPYGFK